MEVKQKYAQRHISMAATSSAELKYQGTPKRCSAVLVSLTSTTCELETGKETDTDKQKSICKGAMAHSRKANLQKRTGWTATSAK
uniref:Uncharacterized protein n=1 Tax=Parascaris univalens TaxID=6257 RepID=A0A914ZVK3_PARUN